MMKIFTNKYSLLILRMVVGFVFLYAGTKKIDNPMLFADSIGNYQLFPELSINLLALFIPWLEVVCGLLLIFGIFVRENAAILSILLFFFTILILITIFRGLEIDCGCFSSSNENQIGIKKIVENVVLLAFSIYLFVYNTDSFKLDRD